MAKKITDKILRELILEVMLESNKTVRGFVSNPKLFKIALEGFADGELDTVDKIKDVLRSLGLEGEYLKFNSFAGSGNYVEVDIEKGKYDKMDDFNFSLGSSDGDDTGDTDGGDEEEQEEETGAGEEEKVIPDEPEKVIPDEPEEIVADEPDPKPSPPVPIATAMSNLSKSLPSDVFDKLKAAVSKVVNLNDLMALRENKNILEPADFEEFFDNFDDHQNLVKKGQKDNVVQGIRTAAIDAYGQVPNNKQAKQDLAAVLKYSQEIENIRATQGVTSGYSLSTSTGQERGGKSPQYLNPEIAQAFDVAFQGNTLQARVQELQAFVNGLKSGRPVGSGISENYGQFIVLELLMKTLTTQEPSSAGTIFESFCAFMAFGGQAIGAENGMADFEWTQGKKDHIGSAKMLKSGTGTSQNVGDMTKSTKSKNYRMTYIVGYKTTNGSPTTAGQIPDKIEFYTFDLFGRSGQTVQIGPVGATSGGGTLRMTKDRVTMSDTIIKSQSGTPTVIDLSGISLGNFDDHSEKIVNSINSDLSSMLDGFSNLKSNIDNYLLAIDNPGERRIYSEQAILEYGKLQGLMTKSKIEGLTESRKVNLKKLLESVFNITEAKKVGYSTLYSPGSDSFFTKKQTELLKSNGIDYLPTGPTPSSFAYYVVETKDIAASILANIFSHKDGATITEKNAKTRYRQNWSNFVVGSTGKQAEKGTGYQQMAKRYISTRSVYKGSGSFLHVYETALENALGQDFYKKYISGEAITVTDLDKLAKQLLSKIGDADVKLNIDKREPKVLTPGDLKGIDPGVDSGYELGSRSGAEKKVDFQVLRAFENMFGTSGSFEQKVAQLSGYIDNINNLLRDKKAVNEPIDNKFSGFIILDILNQLLYDQDATVAGWIFESFLAFMVGGKAIGSGYGAGDFEFPTGEQGSAKFLNDIVSSQNFDELPQYNRNNSKATTIRYVFGVKSSVQGTEIKPTTKKDNTGLLEIYLADATKKGNKMIYKDPYTGKSNTADIDGKGRAEINVGGFEPKILDLTFMQELDFEKVSGAILDDINENVKKCMINLDASRNSLNSYVMNKSDTNNLNKSVQNFNNIKASLIPDSNKEIFGINESKNQTVITPNFLKKLIAESFKK